MTDESVGERLAAATELMVQIASGDLSARGGTSDKDDQVDALITGLNMLAEDLQAAVAARHHAESLLRDERDVYEQAPALFCSVDARSLTVTKCNSKLAGVLGRSKAAILGTSVLDHCAIDERARLEQTLRAAKVDGPPANGEFKLGSTDIELLTTMSATRVHSVAGTERLRLIFQDITKRRRAESKLSENQRLIAVTLRSIGDAVIATDAQSLVQFMNPVAEQLTGWRESECVGKPLDEIFDIRNETTDLRVESPVDKVLRVRKVVGLANHTALVARDGSRRPIADSGAPIQAEDGTVLGVVLVFRDQTEERARESQLRHAQKMEAIGRLAGGVAHDFNNMLCAITGNATLALLEANTGSPVREALEEISGAAEQAADLTRRLLTFSRRQIVAPEVLDLCALVDGLLPMLKRLIGESIVLATDHRTQSGCVLMDRGQAQQVVLNLVLNARDAMPKGGRLTVAVEAQRVERGRANLIVGDYVTLRVTDTGHGIDAAVRDRIFEPFFTTKEPGQGTGLGLATVFGIAEQNGGCVDVVSARGEGASFVVYFPRAANDVIAPAVASTARPPPGTETILVVEDAPAVLKLAVGLLERLGYLVLSANGGENALSAANGYVGKIDLLLTDVVMPHINGRELADKLTRLRPETKVLFTSGYPRSIIAQHGALDRGMHYLAKPYSLQSLATSLREVLDGPS